MTPSVKPIAIIPARGSSKRLPRKNILPWKGIPLIGHCIINALATELFSEVVVSSEDQEILEISERYGASALKREAGLSKDNSTVAEVCLDVMSNYENIIEFCCIYPTAVKLSPETVKKSSEIFQKTKICDFLMGVSLYNYPPQQALIQDENGDLILLNPEFKNIQSQFYKKCFVSNGTLYWARTYAFLGQKNFYGKKLHPFIIDEEQVSDINTPEDYDILIKS